MPQLNPAFFALVRVVNNQTSRLNRYRLQTKKKTRFSSTSLRQYLLNRTGVHFAFYPWTMSLFTLMLLALHPLRVWCCDSPPNGFILQGSNWYERQSSSNKLSKVAAEDLCAGKGAWIVQHDGTKEMHGEIWNMLGEFRVETFILNLLFIWDYFQGSCVHMDTVLHLK